MHFIFPTKVSVHIHLMHCEQNDLKTLLCKMNPSPLGLWFERLVRNVHFFVDSFISLSQRICTLSMLLPEFS